MTWFLSAKRVTSFTSGRRHGLKVRATCDPHISTSEFTLAFSLPPYHRYLLHSSKFMLAPWPSHSLPYSKLPAVHGPLFRLLLVLLITCFLLCPLFSLFSMPYYSLDSHRYPCRLMAMFRLLLSLSALDSFRCLYPVLFLFFFIYNKKPFP